MYRVLLLASFPVSQFLRQTPEGKGVWGNCQFESDPSAGPFDAVVVYDETLQVVECECPPENTLLITGEPPSIRRYRRPYSSQFAHVWTSHRTIDHPRIRLGHEGQPWHYGLHASEVHGSSLNYTQLASLRPPQKTKLCSVICSDKRVTPDQRQRLEFVQLLKRKLGDRIDVFGRGIRPLNDKADAIYDYRYHVVLENDHSQFYMSEKLPDAFLGWSFPVYFGGPEADHLFPIGSFARVDIFQPDVAINIILDLLQHDVYERQMPQLTEARRRVLEQTNVMALLADFWERHIEHSRPRRLRLYPKKRVARLTLAHWTRTWRGRQQAA